jgi:hypothetical protein
VSPLAGRIVQCLRMVNNSLVPHQDCAWLVSDAALEVLSLRNVIKQEPEQVVGLLFVETNNPFCVDGVDN